MTLEERLLAKVTPKDTSRCEWMECWEWEGARLPSGYGVIHNPGGTRYTHRVMAGIHCGVEIPRHLEVLHVCDTPSCCNPHHLVVGTRSDNMRDMHEKGRATSKQSRPPLADAQDGEANTQCKLTAAQVLDIRELYASGNFLQRQLAVRFGVTQGHISEIVNLKMRAKK